MASAAACASKAAPTALLLRPPTDAKLSERPLRKRPGAPDHVLFGILDNLDSAGLSPTPAPTILDLLAQLGVIDPVLLAGPLTIVLNKLLRAASLVGMYWALVIACI